ncbi:unnamed protein product [Penicillium salamii]|nr:unnamed protein product [Penicillium salamii]CAG8050776.1 unnamed protein product [Penicillium salamii]
MFHRFSASPSKARTQSKGSGMARVDTTNKNKITKTDSKPHHDHTVHTLGERQKATRACVRCRVLRIKCDEQKPCAQCVSAKDNCIMSKANPRSSQPKSRAADHIRCESSSTLPPRSPSRRPTHAAGRDNGANASSSTASPNLINSSVLPSQLAMGQDSSCATRNSPKDVPMESFSRAHVQGFFASGQLDSSKTSALGDPLFPQLPHPTLPSVELSLAPRLLLESQRSYYLRLFWDACHPLLPIISKTEFIELDTLPTPTFFHEYSIRSALVDSMIALGIQHSHLTGLAGRILGLRRDYHVTTTSETTWPGFEHFHRCRECMRNNTEVTLEALRCHGLMVVYLMKSNAFRDAYNLLGITIRKAYVAKLHWPPPSPLPEAGKTARMQLWWILFALDLQCSLQLEMPPASQKSLVRCSFPAEDALAR